MLLDLKYANRSKGTRQICSEELKLRSMNEYLMERITHCEVALNNTHDDIETHTEKESIKNKCAKEEPSVECEEALSSVIKCEPWTISDWYFTPGPGLFSHIGGWANITGILLIIILTIMAIGALPAIGIKHEFEAVSYTHLTLPTIYSV